MHFQTASWLYGINRFRFPKGRKKEIRILTSDEQNRLVSFCIKDTNRYKFAILFALMTGMRIGEICALKWSDIYIESRIIKVSTTVQRLKSNNGTSKTELVIGSPKSDYSFRLIPMNDTLVNLCLKMKPLNKNAYILSGTDQLIKPRTLQYKLISLSKTV
ncbi:MAG: tyrosine-type recombinase/integrase [Erysipelotrichaceae bacterium]|nr:tyrosine-type recombinase/integrase [Erysipelotrichaceae bacterium]